MKLIFNWRAIFVIFAISSIIGCTPSNDRGRQYFDDNFEQLLTEVSQVNSNAYRDYNNFNQQMAKVIERSPSMRTRYEKLYTQLANWALVDGDPKNLSQYGVQSAQLSGADKKGNVLFTGYFSPVIEMRHKPDDVFKYPVYRAPKCNKRCPTRREIHAGALKGKGLELGYANNLIDPFLMEVQGSGFVSFGDGQPLKYFAYGGKNNHPYVSIGRILIERGEVPREQMSMTAIKEWVANQDEAAVMELLEHNSSYVFFKPLDKLDVIGSAGIPLLPLASVAADRKLFPMGTPILAEVPILNADGRWSGTHALRLLIVLDTGGAVTNSHLDLYHGMGNRVGQQSGYYRHFGRVWKLGLEGTDTAQPWKH